MSLSAYPKGRWIGLSLWLAVCFSAAAVGRFFPPGDWYAGLNKPSWTPPNWLFAPVWTFLYAAMSVAAWRVWCRGGFRAQRIPLTLFLLQLGLNAVWSWLFFGVHQIALASLEILLLWTLILLTLWRFLRVDRWAGGLLVPYALWVGFASLLCLALWRLN